MKLNITGKELLYDEYRNEGYPCGMKNCEHYEQDVEAQCCYGECTNGDPLAASCRAYVPNPAFILSWAKEKKQSK